MKNRTTERFLDDYLGNFIDTLESSQDETAIRFALQRLAASAGFDRFAYVDMRSSRRYSNYSEQWQEVYHYENYVALDPVVAQAKRTMRPVVWSHSDKLRYGLEERRFFDEARTYGIASGITIPIKAGFGTTALLSLADANESSKPISVRDFAYAATAVAFAHFTLLRVSGEKFSALDIALSPRELTCVVWASLGKTKADTAKVLGITEKTVRFYLERARDKLGASNVAHAVRLAMERDLL